MAASCSLRCGSGMSDETLVLGKRTAACGGARHELALAGVRLRMQDAFGQEGGRRAEGDDVECGHDPC